MPSGGDITEITYNHPTLGTGSLPPKANEDSTYDLGGIRSGDDANMIQSNGEAIRQMNRVRPSFECPVSWDMINRNDLEQLVGLAGDPAPATWTFTNINGVIYRLSGFPVGDLKGNGNTSNIPLKISGSGTMSIV